MIAPAFVLAESQFERERSDLMTSPNKFDLEIFK